MVRSLTKLTSLAALLALGCASEVKMQESNPVPVCRTKAECSAKDGERVEVVGVYTVYDVRPGRKLDDDSPRPVIIMLGDDKGPFLEPFWHEGAARSAKEIARLNGKRVRVRGVYRKEQPKHPSGQPMATMGGACVHPVEAISLESDDAS